MRSFICLLFLVPLISFSQTPSNGMFSLGVRTTHNSFSHDGNGIGSGGHFRIQLTERINTEWFADYISVGDDLIRSNYAHIGWSVIYYPFHIIRIPKFFQRTPRALEMREVPYANLRYSKYDLQPFISAGHCFDYNNKIVVPKPSESRDRWGSAVQAGIGVHLFLTERFDITLSSLYMIHLTPEIEAHTQVVNNEVIVKFSDHSHSGLEGHLLTTLSFNYKIGQLWGRK